MNLTPWFWGLCGAFIYAAPRFSACLYGSSSAPCGKCVIDGAFAMVVGPIAAAAFTASISARLGLKADGDMNAASALIGLLANPVAPGAIQVMVDGAMTKLKKLLGIETQ